MHRKRGRYKNIAAINYVWQSISKLLNYRDYIINNEEFQEDRDSVT